MPLQGVSPCHTAQTTWQKQHLEESGRSGQEGGITDVPFLCLKQTSVFTPFKNNTFLMFLLCFSINKTYFTSYL